jgi:hypothetical protein
MDHRNKWPDDVQRIDTKRMTKRFIYRPIDKKTHTGRRENVSKFRRGRACQIKMPVFWRYNFVQIYRYVPTFRRTSSVYVHGPSESQFGRTVSNFEYGKSDWRRASQREPISGNAARLSNSQGVSKITKLFRLLFS